MRRPKSVHEIDASSGSRPGGREVADLLGDAFERRDEHLARGLRVGVSQLAALRERDHDVRALGDRDARGLGPHERTGRTEVDEQHVGPVEAQQQVATPPLDAGDLAAVERPDELLLGAVTANGLQPVDLHRLDLASDDVALEISAQHLDLR